MNTAARRPASVGSEVQPRVCGERLPWLADIIRRLQKRGLIERHRTKDDARAYSVKLTAAGRRELAKGKPALVAVEKGLMKALPANQRAELLSMLGTIIASSEANAAKKEKERV